MIWVNGDESYKHVCRSTRFVDIRGWFKILDSLSFCLGWTSTHLGKMLRLNNNEWVGVETGDQLHKWHHSASLIPPKHLHMCHQILIVQDS